MRALTAVKQVRFVDFFLCENTSLMAAVRAISSTWTRETHP